MYKEVWPFQLIDLDNKNVSVPEFPTTRNKRSIVYFDGPVEIKTKNKILIIPFAECSLYTPDIREIENEMLDFAKENNIIAGEDCCIHILRTIKRFVYHGFAII